MFIGKNGHFGARLSTVYGYYLCTFPSQTLTVSESPPLSVYSLKLLALTCCHCCAAHPFSSFLTNDLVWVQRHAHSIREIVHCFRHVFFFTPGSIYCKTFCFSSFAFFFSLDSDIFEGMTYKICITLFCFQHLTWGLTHSRYLIKIELNFRFNSD